MSEPSEAGDAGDATGCVVNVEAGVEIDARRLRDVLLAPASFGAELLKENPRRSVYGVHVDGCALVVKHYRERGLSDALKSRAGRSRALREWTTAQALRAAGLPAPAPVAWTRRREGALAGWAAFAMRAVPGAEPLGPYLEARFAPGDGRGAEKRPWIEAAASLLARLHAEGFDHQDFHGGNLLIEGATGDSPDPSRLVVVDLHRVTRPGRLSMSRRVRALADLVHTLRFALDPEDTAGAVAAYLAAAGRPERSEREVPDWTERVERACRRREARRVRSRTRRCVHEGSAFTAVRAGGVRGFARRDVPLPALFEAVAAARHAMETGTAAARSIARRSSVAVATAAARRVAVKRYDGDGRRSARGRVSRGRAGRAYVAAHGLLVRGVPVPPVVAWLRTPDRSFLVVDEVEDALPLSAESFRLAPGGGREGDAFAVAEAVSSLLVRLAESGATVNDLSPKNVLVQRGRGGDVRAWLCDFDGVRLDRPPSRARWIRALAQLNDVSPGVSAGARRLVLRRVAAAVPSLRGRGVAREIAVGTALRASKRLAPPSPASLLGTGA